MFWRRREQEGIDLAEVRSAVGGIVESGRFDTWLDEASDEVLVRIAAPLEMLTFQYHLDPPRDRLLLRAARVAWESVEECLPQCPDDMASAFRGLGKAVAGDAVAG